jgi:hypothetical protein
MGKCADLVTRTIEAQDNFSTGMVKNLDLLVAVVYVHIFLFSVGGETNPLRGAPIIRKAVSSLDPDVLLKVSDFVEDLDSVALSVTHID